MGYPPATKIPRMADPVTVKLLKYFDQFSTLVRTGEFVVDPKRENVPDIEIELKLIETGKVLKFPISPEGTFTIEELLPSKFEPTNPLDWSRLEEGMLNGVKAQLGLETERISISLQKLIIQKPGTPCPPELNQLRNRDEESDKSFGHVILQLPSLYTGGNFRFRYEETRQEFDFSIPTGDVKCLAFFNKLEHDPILSGSRTFLIYNLVIESKINFLPEAPTIQNIVPSLTQVIQEWKETHDLVKVVKYSNRNLKPSAVSNFLHDVLQDNQVTLFHEIFTYREGPPELETQYVAFPEYSNIEKLTLLTSPDPQVEEAYRTFIQDEANNEIPDDEGVRFHLTWGDLAELEMLRKQHDAGDESSVDMYIFFVGENIFHNRCWLRGFPFWRLQTYLFLARYHNMEKTPEFQHAANNLVMLDISLDQLTLKTEYDDCFKNLILKKFSINSSN
ncbi:uncharacterized protein LOC110856473 [Folsomia candida]|nr:uncharacterized protein LOC110856473 [Folsomia candida]XP_035713040.1 uncharacterized protein LOC110856473 [Folsomia candida]